MMSKINVKQRLSRNTKGFHVGVNDARRQIQQKKSVPAKYSENKFDARDHLNKKAKVLDARKMLNKMKNNRTNVKEQTKTKHMKNLMPTPVKKSGRTTIDNGSLTRTVKGIPKIHTSLKDGNLTRTVKGAASKPPIRPERKIPSLLDIQTEFRDNEKILNIQIESQASRKRKRKATTTDIWERSPAPRRSPFVPSIDADYNDYDSLVAGRARGNLQARSSLVLAHMQRSYEYEEPLHVLPDDYARPRFVERGYTPEYTLLRPDEARQFKDFLQQQQTQRDEKLREEILQLEARRRESMMSLHETQRKIYEEQMNYRRSADTYSYGYEVIVSNLIPVIHESEIESCFLQFGKVLSIDFVDKTTAKIKYGIEDDAKAAARFLDNKEIPVIFGTSYIGTKYSKQRISVRLPTRPVLSEPSRSFFPSNKSASRAFVSTEKTERDVATDMRPRSVISRATPLQQPFSSRHIQPGLDATHSALFGGRNAQLGAQSKSFLVRRM